MRDIVYIPSGPFASAISASDLFNSFMFLSFSFKTSSLVSIPKFIYAKANSCFTSA